jgi:hypothetical protein
MAPTDRRVDRTLEFMALTIAAVHSVDYALDERAVISDDRASTRILFDFSMGATRLRSVYVVVSRYDSGLIVEQELSYDPDDRLETLVAQT